MTRVAIIGTAGRKGADRKLSAELFGRMCDRSTEFVDPNDDLVSGGAAWADHVAVVLFLAGRARSLMLHLPAPFDVTAARFEELSEPGRIANYYHDLFDFRTGWKARRAIVAAIAAGATITVSDGFRARNFLVGEVERLIAFTFSPDPRWPEGSGTRHTWNHSSARLKLHVPIDSLR